MHQFFKTLSFILNPIFLIIGLYIIGMVISKFSVIEKLLISTIQLIIPLTFFAAHLYNKKIDFDLTARKTRIPLLTITLVCFIFGTLVIYLGGYYSELKLQGGLFFLILIFTLITIKWKISFHTFVLSMSTVLMFKYFGEIFIYIALITLPLIMYARVYLGKHSVLQVVTGTILGLSITFFLF
ncbi:phosphatase PAP2 family protein [Candidatus Dojkabacteria bacterium]|nr:phosphatase PAP2 family protein [Candidatus Dojkabacteria bacterium]